MATNQTQESETPNSQPAAPPEIKPVFGRFYPANVLYDDNSPMRLYPSHAAMVWALRTYRDFFLADNAIARHTGRIVVDPVQCAIVAEKIALKNISGGKHRTQVQPA